MLPLTWPFFLFSALRWRKNGRSDVESDVKETLDVVLLGKESVPRESLGERDRHTKGSFFINVCGADTDLLPVLVGQSTHTLSKLFGTLEESFAPLPSGIRSLFRVDVGPHHAHVRRVAALSDLEQSQTTLYFFVAEGEPEPPSVAAVPLSDIAASDLPQAVKARLAPLQQRAPKKERVCEPSGPPQEYPPTPHVTPLDSTEASKTGTPPSEPSLGHPRHISPVPPVSLAQTTVPSSFPGGDTRAPVGHVSAIATLAPLPATTLEMVPELTGADVLLSGAPFISSDTEGPLDLASQAWEGQAAVEAGGVQTAGGVPTQGSGQGTLGPEQVVGEELGLPPPPQLAVYGEPMPEAYYEPGIDEGVGPSGFGEAPVSPSYVGFAKYRTPAPAAVPMAAEDGGSEAESEGGRPGALSSGFYVPLPNEELGAGEGGGDLGIHESQARSEEGTELQDMSQRGLAVLTRPEEAEADEQRPWGLAPVMTDTGTLEPVPLPPGGSLGGTIAEGPEQLSCAAHSLSEGLRRSQSEAERGAELDIEKMVRDAVKEASAGTSPQGIERSETLGPRSQMAPPPPQTLQRLVSEGSGISHGAGPRPGDQGGSFGGLPRPASFPHTVGAGLAGGQEPGALRKAAPGPGIEPFYSGPAAPSGASLPPAAPGDAGFQFAPPAAPEAALPQGYALVGRGGSGEFSRDQVGQVQGTGPGLFSESFDAFSGASMAAASGSLLAQPGSATAGGGRERRRRATGPGILLEGLAASGIVPAEMVEREGIEVPSTPAGVAAGPTPLPFYSLPATPAVPFRGAVLPEPSMSHVSSAVAAFVAEQRGAVAPGAWAPAADAGQGRGIHVGMPLSDVSEGGIAVSSAEAKSSESASGQVSASPSRGEIHMGGPGLGAGFGPGGPAPIASQQAPLSEQAAPPTAAAEAQGREQFPVLQTTPSPLAPQPQIDIMNSEDFEAGGRTGAVVREAAEGALPREDLLPGSRAIVAAHGESGAAHQITHLNGLSDITRSPARVVEQAFHPIAAGAVGTEGLTRLQGAVQGDAQADVGPLQAELLGLNGAATAAAPPSQTSVTAQAPPQLLPKLASEGEIFEPSLVPGQEDEGKGLLQGGELSDSASLPGQGAAALPLPAVTPQLAPISVQSEPGPGSAAAPSKQNPTMLFAELAPESFLPPNVSSLPPAPATGQPQPGNAGFEQETRMATTQGAIPPSQVQGGVSDTAELAVGRESSLREPLLGAEGAQDESEGGSPREIGGQPSDLALELESADNVFFPASPPPPREPPGPPTPYEAANLPVGGDINETEAGEGQRYREPSFGMERPLASYPLSGLETPPRGTAAYGQGQPGFDLGRVGAEVYYHGGSVPAAHLSDMASRGASPTASRHAAILFRDSPKVASMVLESLSPAILRTEKDLISDAMSGPGHPRPIEPSDREVEEIAVEAMLEDLEEQRELEGALAPPLSPGKSTALPKEAPVPPRPAPPALGATTPYLSMSGLSSGTSFSGGASGGTGTLAPASTPQAAQFSEFSPVAPTPPPADAEPVTPRSAPPDDVPSERGAFGTGPKLEGDFVGVGVGAAGDAGSALLPRTPRIPAILLQWDKGESGEVSPPPLSAPRRHLVHTQDFTSPPAAAQAASLPLEQGSPDSGPEPSLGPGSPESLSDFASPASPAGGPSLTTDIVALSLASKPLEGPGGPGGTPGLAESVEGSQHVPTPIPVPGPSGTEAAAKSSILLKTLSGAHPLNVDPLGPLPTLAPYMGFDIGEVLGTGSRQGSQSVRSVAEGGAGGGLQGTSSMQVLAPSSGPGGASTAATEPSVHASDFEEGASIDRGISTASIAGSLPHNPSELTTPAVSKTASFSAGGPVSLKGPRGALEPAPEVPTEPKLPAVQVSGAGAGAGASVGGAPQPAASPPVDPNASRTVLIHEEHKRALKDTGAAGGSSVAPELLGVGGVKKGKKKGGFVRKIFAKLSKKKTGGDA